MMLTSFLHACVLYFVCCVGAAPTPSPTPSPDPVAKWPVAFSSSLDVFRHTEQRFYLAKWFRDEKANMERFDTSGRYGWDIDIRDYNMGMRYTVYHINDEIKCVESALNETIPKIDFSTYKYSGKVTINTVLSNQFDGPSGALFSRYFQSAASSDPVRLETRGSRSDEILDFFEFDAGSQEADLFNISIAAPNVVCNSNIKALGSTRMAWLDAFGQEKIDYYSPPAMTEPTPNLNRTMDCESGDASWYSCSGTATCGGCDPSQYIAAHKTLPCGTAITVTDTQNGKSVHVKVGDRGPYVSGRIVDMNEAPAKALDMISAGVVPARVCW